MDDFVVLLLNRLPDLDDTHYSNMGRSPASFDMILQGLRTGGLDRDERRTQPRAPLRVLVTVMPLSLNSTGLVHKKVWIRDVSRTGFGLLMNESAVVYTHMLVKIPSGDGLRWVVTKVMRTHSVSKELCIVGVKMVKLLSNQEAEAVMRGGIQSLSNLMISLSARGKVVN